MTPAELDALEALSLDATDAPWAHDPNDLTITTDPFVVGKVISVALCELDRKWNSDVEFEVAQINAKLIAASRNALPALIEMARRCAAYEAGEKGGE